MSNLFGNAMADDEQAQEGTIDGKADWGRGRTYLCKIGGTQSPVNN
jgi:hypothetical protein